MVTIKRTSRPTRTSYLHFTNLQELEYFLNQTKRRCADRTVEVNIRKICNMAPFKLLHDVGFHHHFEEVVTMQKLLYRRERPIEGSSDGLPSYSSSQVASPKHLIKELYDGIAVMLRGIWMSPDKGNKFYEKEDEDATYLVNRFSILDSDISAIDLSKVESLLLGTGNEELYAEIFWALAEMTFLNCTSIFHLRTS